MKKAVVFALTGIMAVSMFGCGSKKQVEVSSVDDLKDLTIGVQTGTTGDSYASDAVASDSQMKRYNKGADAIQALKTGKIDAVVIDSLPAQKFVDANDDLKIVENIWEPEEYAICLKKGNTELTEKMNAAIKELKEDGTLDKIMANIAAYPFKSDHRLSDENGDRGSDAGNSGRCVFLWMEGTAAGLSVSGNLCGDRGNL